MVEYKNLMEVIIGNITDDDETISFKTYKNYLISLSRLIKKEFGEEDYLKNIFIEINKNLKIDRKNNPNIEKIKGLLFNCWHTELNFLLPTTIGPSFMKYSVHWSPIQVYYSIYLSIRSLFESSNSGINSNHAQTLRTISDWIVKRNLFPYPWNCYCGGLEELKNLKFHGFREKVSEVSMLAYPSDETIESCFAKFLKTTRERQFKLKREGTEDIITKKGERKKSWTSEDKKLVEKRISYTTIFDCIYRLRIKSNYENVDAYILSNMSDEDSIEFYESLKIILESTLLVLESFILKHFGKKEIGSVIEEFATKINSSELRKKGIFIRKKFLISNFN